MTDTQWPDISSYQPYLGSIPYRAVAIRSNDGTYRDTHFAHNLAQCKTAVAAGEFDFFLVYLVFETNWSETFATFKSMVGTPHPRMAVMIDVESWGGKIRGDHSAQIMALRNAIAGWLGSSQRVGWYANAGDHNTLAPNVSMAWFVLANYSDNPATPAHFAHQYSNHVHVSGLGNVDMNSADGYTVAGCMKVLGVAPKPIPTPVPVPANGHLTDAQFDAIIEEIAKMTPAQRAAIVKEIASATVDQVIARLFTDYNGDPHRAETFLRRMKDGNFVPFPAPVVKK